MTITDDHHGAAGSANWALALVDDLMVLMLSMLAIASILAKSNIALFDASCW
ncbi:hypothetical protein Cflav_PD6169 [Pedosphaera parvula Ellin514]|uniref:Uncharacterized protein n=1 Tax=Pedosphaera parvula (strain Ellin514) TaxID=320771 RepID=B9XHK1_PEDPL|nr:hypothetical protein Cflav_PD6169 [Pedosphaera parvula Ellin514]